VVCLAETLSVIIPAFNEEKRILSFLVALLDFKNKNSFFEELIVVNDGSTDNTARVLQSFGNKIKLLEHRQNKGKGAAVKTGVLAAKGNFIVFADADGATPVSQIKPMLSALKKFDLVAGARNLKDSKITRKKPVLRRVFSWLANHYANLLFSTSCSDVFCGFKGMKKNLAKKVFAKMLSSGWAFDAELLARANGLQATIGQIPIEWRFVKGSKLRLNQKLFSAFFYLLELKKILKKERVLQ